MRQFRWGLLAAFVLGALILLPFLHQSDAGLSAEEVKKCRVQASMFFDGLEHLFVTRVVVAKHDERTYYVRAYSYLGIPYDGAVVNVLEPYNEAKYADKKYVENQWNCEGSMTRIGFHQAAP